jgi:hypothetical protein
MVKLAIDGINEEGWYPMGEIEVTDGLKSSKN